MYNKSHAGLIVVLFLNQCIRTTSSIEVTNSELMDLTEELFSSENPIFKNAVNIRLQGHVTGWDMYEDLAPDPLLAVNQSVLETPLIESLLALLDNYEPNSLKAESVTPEEHEEEEKFIEALLDTAQVDRTMRFLSDRNIIKANDESYREILRDVWFTQYARQRSGKKRGSSGFEHVFLGEFRGTKILGLHNWISFNAAEAAGELNYYGYKKSKTLGDKSSGRGIVYAAYSRFGRSKSSTFFVGTSPELEISLYTLCYLLRPDEFCRISLGGTIIKVKTYILDHNKNGIKPSLGSAFVMV